jgi:hypothetical protein
MKNRVKVNKVQNSKGLRAGKLQSDSHKDHEVFFHPLQTGWEPTHSLGKEGYFISDKVDGARRQKTGSSKNCT